MPDSPMIISAEMAGEITLMPTHLVACQKLYAKIQEEWVGFPYWPTKVVFKSEWAVGHNELRVDLYFDSIGDEENYRCTFYVPWSAALDSIPLGEAWGEFVTRETKMIRNHFVRSIGLRVVQDERIAAIEAREAARKTEEPPDLASKFSPGEQGLA